MHTLRRMHNMCVGLGTRLGLVHQFSSLALFDSSQVEYLQSVDDGISKRILLTRGFPLGQTLESTVYVSFVFFNVIDMTWY